VWLIGIALGVVGQHFQEWDRPSAWQGSEWQGMAAAQGCEVGGMQRAHSILLIAALKSS